MWILRVQHVTKRGPVVFMLDRFFGTRLGLEARRVNAAKRWESGTAGLTKLPSHKASPFAFWTTPRVVPRGVPRSLPWRGGGWRYVHSLGGSSEDTVFAVSTPPGRGGVAVVRVSGPLAGNALVQISKGGSKDAGSHLLPKPRMAQVRNFVDPEAGEVLDRGIVLWFPGPASFTGEDVVELHLHGSMAVVQAVLRVLGGVRGLRAAEPGEFTRRSLLNGKMDLVEAEGLADLLSAETEVQRKVALRQMGGEASRLYDRWREVLIRSLAHVEAFIDFGEDEEIHQEVLSGVVQDAKRVASEIRTLCDDARCGEIVREGLKIVLAGPPNAGKSSFLNALAKRPAAITNARPGTTRDILQVNMDLSGLAVSVTDTAGLRLNASDEVEQEGISRAAAAWTLADIRVLVLDASSGLDQIGEIEDVMLRETEARLGISDETTSQPAIEHRGESHVDDFPASMPYAMHGTKNKRDNNHTLVLLNKADLLTRQPTFKDDEKSNLEVKVRSRLGNVSVLTMSCATGEGVDAVISALHSAATSKIGERNLENSVLITRPRHRVHLQACEAALQKFCAFENTPDVAAEELRNAVGQLGAITGRVHVEQVLDVLFADFCIGK